MKKEDKKINDLKQEIPEKQGAQELSNEEMEQVSGGGAFDNVPRVKEHDYTDDIKNRV